MEFFGMVLLAGVAFGGMQWWWKRRLKKTFGVGSMGGLFRVAQKQAQAWDLAVTDVADTYGLSVTPPLRAQRLSASGEIDGLPVAIVARREDRGDSTRRITRLEVDVNLPRTLRMRAESPVELLRVALIGQDATVGSEAFDAETYVDGLSPALLTSLCAGETRRALARWFRSGGSIEDGALHFPLTDIKGPADITAAIERARSLGEHLTQLRPSDPQWVQERLSQAALTDPETGFRIQAATLLIQTFRDAPLAVETADRLLDADHPMLRVRGATLSDLPQAVDVAQSVALDAAASRDARVAAVVVLAERFPASAQASDAVTTLLQDPTSKAFTAALMMAPRLPPAPLDILSALVTEDDPNVTGPVIVELIRHGRAAQSPMLELVANAETPGAVQAALSVLSATADIHAVVPLKAAAEVHTDAATARALETTIATIQARTPGAKPGQLSFSEATEGQLSVSEAAERAPAEEPA